VGRDLLVGLATGAWICALLRTHDLIYGPSWFPDLLPDLSSAATAPRILGRLSASVGSGLTSACFMLFFVLIGGALLRRRWLVVMVMGSVLAVLYSIGSVHPLFSAAFGLAAQVVGLILVLYYYGLLGGVAAVWVVFLPRHLPLTLDSSAWYFGAGLTGMLSVAAVGYYAYRAAVAGEASAHGRDIRY
jgi:hypothetical protein